MPEGSTAVVPGKGSQINGNVRVRTVLASMCKVASDNWWIPTMYGRPLKIMVNEILNGGALKIRHLTLKSVEAFMQCLPKSGMTLNVFINTNCNNPANQDRTHTIFHDETKT